MRNIYQIMDAGEVWLYSEESAEDAMAEHIMLNMMEACEMWSVTRIGNIIEPATLVEDNRVIEVVDAGPNGETITQTAWQWASQTEGLVSTTAY